MHKQVTCQLGDRLRLDEPGVKLAREGNRRLLPPVWEPGGELAPRGDTAGEEREASPPRGADDARASRAATAPRGYPAAAADAPPSRRARSRDDLRS
jgi:hypothetical protein